MGKFMWTGSDLLYANLGALKHSNIKKYPYILAYWLFAKVLDFFVEGHYVVSEHLIKELKTKKKVKVLVDPPLYPNKIEKVKHDDFNVLFYLPVTKNQKFTDWVYGDDIARNVMSRYGDDTSVFFIYVFGNDDMNRIYPEIDFYLRPNRHDGNPRMIMECEINGIPYYWSKENPDIDEIIKQIEEVRNG